MTYKDLLSGTHAPHSETLSFCPSLLAGPVICLEKSDLRDFFPLSQLYLIAMTVVSTVVSYS